MTEKYMKIKALSVIALALCTFPIAADDSSTARQLDAILAELQKIRATLEVNSLPRAAAQPTPQQVMVDTTGAPMLGKSEAPVTIVEFMDFQCPYCKNFYSQTFQDLKKFYIDTGKVRFYVIDFPLEIHAQAMLAAEAGKCANEQRGFWRMYDSMERESDLLDSKKLSQLADKVGLDSAQFKTCLTGDRDSEIIKKNATEWSKRGIRATPTFVIGRSLPKGVEGEVLLGAMPLGVFQQKIVTLSGTK
jgi:protein-disulfide isomerase